MRARALFVATLSFCASAETRVSTFAELEAAIGDGAHIKIDAGITFQRTLVIPGGAAVTIESPYPHRRSLDAANAIQHFHVDGALTLHGVTLTNGFADADSCGHSHQHGLNHECRGGSIYAGLGASLSLVDVEIFRSRRGTAAPSTRARDGGGIWVEDKASIYVSSTTFASNSPDDVHADRSGANEGDVECLAACPSPSHGTCAAAGICFSCACAGPHVVDESASSSKKSSKLPVGEAVAKVEVLIIIHVLAVVLGLVVRRPPRLARRHARPACAMRLNPEKFDGSDLTITEYPMPVLRGPCADIVDFDDDFKQTCKEMMSIMYQADGVGLAATQVGLWKRFFVYNPTGDRLMKPYERIVVNPRITKYGEATADEEEGCLSSRSENCAGVIRRSLDIWVEYVDERNKKRTKKLSGFEARVFQHEYDHIEGVLHIDRLSPEDRAKVEPELERMVAEYGPGGALTLTPEILAALRPEVRSGRMPPMEPPAAPAKKAKKKKKKPAKTGFG
ncbi:peptide deformylase [Aureococcus anophagefferens]|nr:peptide deformylase [Aureococcus anophagefferens]